VGIVLVLEGAMVVFEGVLDLLGVAFALLGLDFLGVAIIAASVGVAFAVLLFLVRLFCMGTGAFLCGVAGA
jgi:hypothetical protein